MRTNNLYEAIIDFCRIMAIFILFSIIVNLFSSCESVEETVDPCVDNQCFIVDSVEAIRAGNNSVKYYLIKARKMCNNESFSFERTPNNFPNYQWGYKYCE